MKTRIIALLLCLSACDDDEARGMDTQPLDAGVDAQAASDSRATLLAASLRKWKQLASEHPGAYWYEEENCLINGPDGHSSVVQVDSEDARVTASRDFPREECIAQVNRYGNTIGESPTPPSFPRMHELCAALLKWRADATFSVDEQGIVDACWVGDAPGCFDNCGSGFALRDRCKPAF
jgi:hypothetical protein